MNQDDKQFMTQFVIVLGALLVFTVVIFIIARVVMSFNSTDYGPLIEKQVEERTAPVGEAHSGEVPKAAKTAAAGGSGAGGGEQTYTQVCASCHDSGTAGAPKITDKAAWQSRIKQGTQTLYDHAINGFNAMPAKGGDPSLSDEDVQAAVDHMVDTVSGGTSGGKQAGKASAQDSQASGGQAKGDQKSVGTGAAAAGAGAGIEQAAKRGASPENKSIYQTMCSSCHDSGALGAPKVTDNAAWQARVATGAEALYSSAISGIGAMPAKGGHSQLSEDEVKKAVDYIIAQVSGDTGSAKQQPAKSAVQGKSPATGKAEPSSRATAQTAAGKAGIAQAAARGGSPENKSIYQAMCSACHDSGALGAPKVTDKAMWQARVAKGSQALYGSAISGIGAMPAKGGHSQLSEDEVRMAVDYIIAQVSDAKAAGESNKKPTAKTDASSQQKSSKSGSAETTKPSKAGDAQDKPAGAKSAAGAAGEKAQADKAQGKADATGGAALAAGKKTYESVCSTCHDTGMAGAPKYGDKGGWASRLKGGKANLYKSAINGKGAMPAKGGNPQLSEQDVKGAVDYMLNAVQ